uniref:Putative secreted protein n=1 Tax=Ixodes ricinus TaxID=34613 RepID=A0A6B0UBS7_IXORI
MSPFPDTRLMLNLFVWLWTWPVSSMMVPGTSGCRGRSIGTSQGLIQPFKDSRMSGRDPCLHYASSAWLRPAPQLIRVYNSPEADRAVKYR